MPGVDDDSLVNSIAENLLSATPPAHFFELDITAIRVSAGSMSLPQEKPFLSA